MENEILEQSKRCLNCVAKPCSEKGCPINTKIPEFIMKIKNDELEEAYKILIENNICSHICSVVCPQEWQCEGSCVRGIKGEPVSIGELEKFVNEWAEENNINYDPEMKEKNGKNVAIIGSGPAGIECAYELLKNGFGVTIFEKENILGGVLNYGIPDFRLNKKLIANVFEKLQKMGLKIVNATFGNDIDLQYLQENFYATFIAIGAGKSSKYKLNEKDIEGIYDSSEILKIYNSGNKVEKLGNVIVIGGGNVAMDSARVAKRMGAESVKILYRRDREHMPAREIELDDALKDGVEFMPLTRVDSANEENGKIVSVNCVKTEIVDSKARDIENTQFEVRANTVIFAIGQKVDKTIFEKYGINIADNGLVEIDENYMTNIKNVYAGGDIVLTNQTVCNALNTGKKVAENIEKSLTISE